MQQFNILREEAFASLKNEIDAFAQVAEQSALDAKASEDQSLINKNESILAAQEAQASADIATGTQSTTTLQDTSKSWGVNAFVNRRVKFLSATGAYQELTITSNTSNTLTFGAGTAPVTGATAYAILQAPVKGVGIDLKWTFGMSDTSKRGSILCLPRGGATLGYDRLNIQNDSWDLSSPLPNFETLSTGSMYAYDGGDYIYFIKEVTRNLYRINVSTWEVEPIGQYPYLSGTAIIGNRMEVFSTKDGLKFLWLNRHSAQDCFRTLLQFNTTY